MYRAHPASKVVNYHSHHIAIIHNENILFVSNSRPKFTDLTLSERRWEVAESEKWGPCPTFFLSNIKAPAQVSLLLFVQHQSLQCMQSFATNSVTGPFIKTDNQFKQ